MVDTILSILSSALPVCIMAIGIFITFRILDFADMTAEGSVLLGGAITVVAIKAGINPFVAVLLAALTGAAAGAFTGFINKILKVPKLLSGIITMTACGGIVFFIFGYNQLAGQFNGSVQLNEEATIYSIFYNLPGERRMWQILVMLLFVVVIMFIIYFFFGTEYGMAIRSTGINEKMARSLGINTTISTIVCIAISNALIAIGSSLIYQLGGQVHVGVESGRLVIGLASVLIGEAIFGKRSFKNWLISVALGSIVYYIVITLVLSIGPVVDQIKSLIYALLILLGLCLPMIKSGVVKLFKKIVTKIKNHKMKKAI